jgi:voltage-gated potassium channel
VSLRNELIVVALALLSVGLLVFDAVAELQPHQQQIIERVDVGIAVIFLIDFFWRLRAAENRKAFLRSSWWELLAAIPITTDMTRALRGLRLLRLLRVLRIVRLAVRMNLLMARMRAFRETTHIVTITVTVTTIILSGALGFHYFEFGVNPAVKGFGDSVWWALMTVTTVGYGDVYPHTTPGRVVAVILLIAGIGTFATYAGAVAAWMLRKPDRDHE